MSSRPVTARELAEVAVIVADALQHVLRYVRLEDAGERETVEDYICDLEEIAKRIGVE